MLIFQAPKCCYDRGICSPHKLENHLIRNIRSNGYSGELYLVNLKGGGAADIAARESDVAIIDESLKRAVIIAVSMKGESMNAEREEILDRVEKKAYANERDYHGCSQSALAALQDVFGVRDDAVFQAASGLGGGIGLTAQTCCGGLTGGCMFISQLCGRQREKDGSFGDKENRRFKAYKYCQLLTERFFIEYNACNCSEIQKKKLDGDSYVLAEPEQFQKFIERGAHSHVCPEVVSKAARWAAEIVLDNLEDLGLTDKVHLE